jgi:hypothetical protein
MDGEVLAHRGVIRQLDRTFVGDGCLGRTPGAGEQVCAGRPPRLEVVSAGWQGGEACVRVIRAPDDGRERDL